MSTQDEMDRVIGNIEHELGQLRALRARQVLQLADAGETITGRARPVQVLTHACISGNCGQCFDEPDGAA